MFEEFKTFISRGNVLDLAVGVIIGAAFGKIVTSLTDDRDHAGDRLAVRRMSISPTISSGSARFPTGYEGSLTNYAALKEAGVPMIGYGDFITQLVNFLILAWVIFLIVQGRQQGRCAKPRTPPRRPAQARSNC